MPKVDCIFFVWRPGNANTGYNPESGMCLWDGEVPACTHCLKYVPKAENLKKIEIFEWINTDNIFSGEHPGFYIDHDCLKSNPENLKTSATWDMSDRDPIQDIIDVYWREDPKSMPDKHLNEFVKRMIPKERWPDQSLV